MRFLIVDDDQRKAESLSAELLAAGVRSADIVIADTAAAARRELSQSAFDAMLIDVLLPARANAQPSGETSLELICQIIDDGASAAPKYIVGVTASLDALRDHEAAFRNKTLLLLPVNPASDEWKVPLRNLVLFMQRARDARDKFDYDICVLCALRTPEMDAILQTWPITAEPEKLLNGSVLYRDSTIEISGVNRRLVLAHPAQMGPIAAAHATESLLRKFRPRVLLMTGICGGFSDHVKVGDVVIADRTWDWQSGKWADGVNLLAAPDQREASARLLGLARTIENDRAREFHDAFSGARPENQSRVLIGPMVTGSSVVASIDIQRVFRQQHRKMLGVDMECYGVYYAVSMSPGPQTEVICVKAVSDLADREKADDFQRFCSHMSALVGLEVVQKHFAT